MQQRPPRLTLFPYTTLFRSFQLQSPRSLILPSLHLIGRFHRGVDSRSEEHTSELQSRFDLVCRLLLEKKKRSLVGPAAGIVKGRGGRTPFRLGDVIKHWQRS